MVHILRNNCIFKSVCKRAPKLVVASDFVEDAVSLAVRTIKTHVVFVVPLGHFLQDNHRNDNNEIKL